MWIVGSWFLACHWDSQRRRSLAPMPGDSKSRFSPGPRHSRVPGESNATFSLVSPLCRAARSCCFAGSFPPRRSNRTPSPVAEPLRFTLVGGGRGGQIGLSLLGVADTAVELTEVELAERGLRTHADVRREREGLVEGLHRPHVIPGFLPHQDLGMEAQQWRSITTRLALHRLRQPLGHLRRRSLDLAGGKVHTRRDGPVSRPL